MSAARTALARVKAEALTCRRCPLYRNATQTVFGEGPVPASVMLVGEQPGDREDVAGRPFVGPAGRMLDKALAAAGLDRETVYLTNAVKHFKNEPRGKRRLHKRPTAGEIDICKHWLAAELDLVRPSTVVALGASAVRALLGRPGGVEDLRGNALALADGRLMFVTIHPSLLLRIPDRLERERAFGRFVADLAGAADAARARGVARRAVSRDSDHSLRF
jgi:uracil-DNA glycosylase family protein